MFRKNRIGSLVLSREVALSSLLRRKSNSKRLGTFYSDGIRCRFFRAKEFLGNSNPHVIQ